MSRPLRTARAVAAAPALPVTRLRSPPTSSAPAPSHRAPPPPPAPPRAGEVARVLAATSHYEVLGLAQGADDAAVRAAKRAKSLATHPDKLGAAPGERPGRAAGRGGPLVPRAAAGADAHARACCATVSLPRPSPPAAAASRPAAACPPPPPPLLTHRTAPARLPAAAAPQAPRRPSSA